MAQKNPKGRPKKSTASSGKTFNENTGSFSNAMETNTKSDDLALVNTIFIPEVKEEREFTDEEIEQAIVLPNGATTIDFMMPEDEKEILQKNLDKYGDIEEMNKLLKKAKQNKLLGEELRTLELIEGLGNLSYGVNSVLADSRNLKILDMYIQNLLESGGDIARAYKEAALASKAMLDARETMLGKLKAGKTGKSAKIAVKFTNGDEEYTLGAEIE